MGVKLLHEHNPAYDITSTDGGKTWFYKNGQLADVVVVDGRMMHYLPGERKNENIHNRHELS